MLLPTYYLIKFYTIQGASIAALLNSLLFFIFIKIHIVLQDLNLQIYQMQR